MFGRLLLIAASLMGSGVIHRVIALLDQYGSSIYAGVVQDLNHRVIGQCFHTGLALRDAFW